MLKCIDKEEKCKLVPCSCPLKSCSCPTTVSIVCADGKNYQNECVAKCAGAVKIIVGRCPFTPPIDPTTESNVCKNQFFARQSNGQCSPIQPQDNCN